ncbi:hypothetical protein PM033_17795, partial [Halorubrum ezzemoulense]|uniref:hypothetical protein n=1 Tax=Halorubrum ezzemoulense TaxID=337243 RepID=UPI00232FED92
MEDVEALIGGVRPKYSFLLIHSALNVVVLTLFGPKSEEKTFYEEFTVSAELESDSQRIMKAAFRAFEPLVESGAS